LENAAATPENWISHGLDYAETRFSFSKLNDITTENVKNLGLEWSYNLNAKRGVEATPIVVDGIMYLTGTWSKVFALDVRTGKEIWTYDPKVPRETGEMRCGQ